MASVAEFMDFYTAYIGILELMNTVRCIPGDTSAVPSGYVE